jgi:5-methylcytosine-specific restriction endonuclease McrA
MQTDPNLVVDWDSWLRSRPGDIRRPDRVIVRLGDDWHCQFCSRRVNAGSRAEHHLGHMLDLDAWLVAQEVSGPKPDSTRRSTDRRDKRRLAREQAEAFGLDPNPHALTRCQARTAGGHRCTRCARLGTLTCGLHDRTM